MDRYLSQHPDIFMGVKESHFFSPEVVRDKAFVCPKERFDSFFAEVTDQTIIGEGSVHYLVSREAAKNIHAFNPDSKILIHVRNPVDFLYSHHSQQVFEGYEDIKDFEAAYDAVEDRRKGLRINDKCRFEMILDYPEMANFADQIQRYFDVFGRDQVMVTLFDDFKRDTAAVYRDTLLFLGVDPDFRPEFPVVNPNKKVRSRALMNFIRNTPDWVTFCSNLLLPLSARTEIKAWIKRKNTKFEERDPMDPVFRARLVREMAPRIEELSKLLNWDLSHWTS